MLKYSALYTKPYTPSSLQSRSVMRGIQKVAVLPYEQYMRIIGKTASNNGDGEGKGNSPSVSGAAAQADGDGERKGNSPGAATQKEAAGTHKQDHQGDTSMGGRHEVSLGENQGFSPDEILAQMPDEIKSNAGKLLDFVRLKGLLWNRNGEIKYRGNFIPGSNITELIKGSQIRKNEKHGLTGSKAFYKFLIKNKVPSELLNNKKRKSQVELAYLVPSKVSAIVNPRPPSAMRNDTGLNGATVGSPRLRARGAVKWIKLS